MFELPLMDFAVLPKKEDPPPKALNPKSRSAGLTVMVLKQKRGGKEMR